jgi:hemerythrin-like domain-containing protein
MNMTFQTQVSRMLDEEHRANLELLARVEKALVQPRAGDPELARLSRTLVQHLELELTRHFDFEERELFPRMDEAGDGEIGALLTEEHVAIREVAGELMPLARAAASGTIDDAALARLKRAALEMVERLVAHIQKETVALLPLLDDLLDEDDDRELASSYAIG